MIFDRVKQQYPIIENEAKAIIKAIEIAYDESAEQNRLLIDKLDTVIKLLKHISNK